MIRTDNSILEPIDLPELKERGIRLFVKRDDLIHPEISGNKWRKLKYFIELCDAKKKTGILTFGGAFSNHLLATASACSLVGLKSIGLVRGEELNPESNSTLKRCQQLGMDLKFISREEYYLRNDKAYHETLAADYPEYQLVAEGGAGYYGMIGCQEILKEIEEDFDHIYVAQGTTTTSCGLLLGLKENQQLHVIPALKGFDSLAEMKNLLSRSGFDIDLVEELLESVIVHDEFHFGGYGKYTEELLTFIQRIYLETELKLDPVYTGKAFYGMMKVLKSGEFDNKTVVFVHTGGLQGVEGIEQKSGVKLFESPRSH